MANDQWPSLIGSHRQSPCPSLGDQPLFPTSLKSENGPEFTFEIFQNLLKNLNIPQCFHTLYPPQSSGKFNHSLQNILIKHSQEHHVDWIKLLPLALLGLTANPKKYLSITHFEFMYTLSILPPGLMPQLLPLPYHLLTPLLCHLIMPYPPLEFQPTLSNSASSWLLSSPINIGHLVFLSPSGHDALLFHLNGQATSGSSLLP